jgi:hypothetical protein
MGTATGRKNAPCLLTLTGHPAVSLSGLISDAGVEVNIDVSLLITTASRNRPYFSVIAGDQRTSTIWLSSSTKAKRQG